MTHAIKVPTTPAHPPRPDTPSKSGKGPAERVGTPPKSPFHSGPARSPSPLQGMRMGEAPITLDMAKAELQKLRETEAEPTHQLRKDLSIISFPLVLRT